MWFKLYWKQILLGIAVLLIAAAVSYVWWLRNSLDKAHLEIETMKGTILTLQGDLNNARTRTQIDDRVRRSDDPTSELRDRFTRPE